MIDQMKRNALIAITIAAGIGSSLLAMRACSNPFGQQIAVSPRQMPTTGGHPTVTKPPPNAYAVPLRRDPSPDPEAERKLLAMYATPVTFYGKVVDQRGAQIEGANVQIKVHDKPEGEGTSYQKTSDSGGNFSITGVRGIGLYVEVFKPGYYRVYSGGGKAGSSDGFNYGFDTTGRGIHEPNPAMPVLFVLYRPGIIEPLVHQRERNPSVPKDGSVVKLSLDPGAPNGPHLIEVQCWTNDTQRDAQDHYDWRFKVSVPGGGLVARVGQFAFEAPADGYQPSDEYVMPQSPQGRQWEDSVEKSYFIRFNDDIYARVNLEMIAHGAHFVVFSSYLNPNAGSRNLEIAPVNQ